MPEPVLVSIAAALATKGFVHLYELVKQKFAGDEVATLMLESSERAAEDSKEVRRLAGALEEAEQEDPAFKKALREEWQKININPQVAAGGVSNVITGTVHGMAIQARDIKGDINYGGQR
ncbi:hypothetical protein JOF53_004765 [Crossiella equi]|uniref:Uncharacterized protein n=1 Tax=Crossiella equi TaxID=130796 RepID=A0ABS5AH46_9PSEU|nr:hypothetical protein [Crossiella equi]MBP2475893.1 hypothetical protein [Crossiella equi]